MACPDKPWAAAHPGQLATSKARALQAYQQQLAQQSTVRLLLRQFLDPALELQFSRWYTARVLVCADRVSLPLALLACALALALQPAPVLVQLLLVVAGSLDGYLLQLLLRKPVIYAQQRSGWTACRRALSFLYLAAHLLQSSVVPGTGVADTVWNVLVAGGPVALAVANVAYLDAWPVAAFFSLLWAPLVSAAAAAPVCDALVSAGSEAAWGWRGLAELYLAAQGSVLPGNMLAPHEPAEASCKAALTATQVLFGAATCCAAFFLERRCRAAFLQQQQPDGAACAREQLVSHRRASWLDLLQAAVMVQYACVAAWMLAWLAYGGGAGGMLEAGVH